MIGDLAGDGWSELDIAAVVSVSALVAGGIGYWVSGLLEEEWEDEDKHEL